jgi:hypothetical protein
MLFLEMYMEFGSMAVLFSEAERMFNIFSTLMKKGFSVL